jgi:hypothetical protein
MRFKLDENMPSDPASLLQPGWRVAALASGT